MSGLIAWLLELARKHRNELGLLVAIGVVVAFTATVDSSYRTKTEYNAKEILRETSLLGIFALGAAIVIISGGIDLSSGAMIAFSGTICASIILLLVPTNENGVPDTENISAGVIAAAFAGTILVALIVGSFHAWLITAVHLPPFVATLASLVGLRSLARVLVQDVTQAATTEGSSTKMYINDKQFLQLGEWWIPLTVFFVLALVLWILMGRTVVGRHLYAMGGNEEAARLSGIRTDRLKWLAYCIGSVTSAIAGILYLGFLGTADPTSAAMGYELNAIAAAVVGGCSLMGGIGTVPGVMLGALFLRVVIDSVAKTVKIAANDFEGLVVGLLVVLAVAFNELRSAGGLRKKFFTGGLGIVNIFVLAILAGTIVALMKNRLTTSPQTKLVWGFTTAGVVLVLLSVKKFLESRDTR